MSSSPEDIAKNLAEKRLQHIESLRTDPSGLDWCKDHSLLLDQLWQLLYSEVLYQFPDAPPFAIVATGGYGREEVSPESDADVSIIPSIESQELTNSISWLYRQATLCFTGILGVQLSYTYRPINDVPGLDHVSVTGLLDLRHLAGSEELSQQMQEVIFSHISPGSFILSKVREREKEKGKTHHSPLVVEPNLKLGAGGLRDFNVMNWIGFALGERLAPPTDEYDQILSVRNAVQMLNGRNENKLTLQKRHEISHMFKLTPRELGARLAKSLDTNHQQYLEGLERLKENRYLLIEGASATKGEVRFEQDCTQSNAAQAVYYATHLGLRIPPQPVPQEQGNTRQTVLSLSEGSKTLRNLDQCGLLSALLPELTDCRYLMPSDASHRYSVFEHTIKCIEHLESITPDHKLFEILGTIEDQPALHLSLLLHDTGKRIDSETHSIVGARLAKECAERLDLGVKRTNKICWLIENHLVMAKFMRIRDVRHPETISEFAKIVQDSELLKMLTILTWCDVKSVNPQALTPIQESALIELYLQTQSLLNSNNIELYQTKYSASKEYLDNEIPNVKMEEFLNSLPGSYLLSTKPKVAQSHYYLAQKARQGEINVLMKTIREMHVSEITLCCHDQPGLLSEVLGILYANDIAIHELRIATTNINPPIALDTFIVTSNRNPLGNATQSKVLNQIENVLQGNLNKNDLLKDAGKDPMRVQDFLEVKVIDHNPMVIEFRAPRGRGLAYRLSRMIFEQGLDVVSARFGQWAGNASGAFYVKEGANRLPSPEDLRQALSGE